MKVDKGVCTTNDAYFAGNNNNNVSAAQSATNELNSIIKFETVFTTLVENKILAIKRECEQHESKKKSRTLKSILLRKSTLPSAPAIETATTTTPLTPTAPLTDSIVGAPIDEDGPTNDTDTNRKKDGKNFFFKYRKRPTKDDVEKGNAQSDNEQFKEVPSKVNDDDELVNVIVVPNESINQQQDDKDVADAKLDSQSNELVIAADVDARNLFNLPVSNAKLITDDKQNNCDKLIINSQTTDNNNAQVTPSTTKSNCKQNVTSFVQQQQQLQIEKEELKEVDNLELPTTTINNENDESLATTIDISLQQSSIVVLSKEHAGELPINNQINNNSSNNNNVNDKSDVAICDDGLSSQNTSDIEFSLVSENSITDLPEKLRKKVTAGVAAMTTVTNSDPIIKKSVNVISPPLTRHDKKQCERKAKSCQSTPIFGRHKHVRSESEGKKILTFQRELPTKKYETKITDAIKSETIVIAPASTSAAIATITTTTLASKSIPAVSSGPLESVHMTTTKKIQKHSSKHRDVSIEYEITYDDDNENQSPHGFISSFNQLTSQKQPAAIISANLKKQSSKLSKGQQGKDSIKSQHETEKTVTNQEVELELDELNVDVVNKKKRRRRHSSRSDPVYPSTSSTGLKHCILSRPPNQPIQIDYDQGFMYDVSLQIESEFNGDVKSIVPAEHKRHRRKHHDHERCRKKKKKRKIFVHNLDDKSLKVIDPDSDELPQRAKFTIIATACLLLIMCLLLVGVTLRMAPLIDDMVRQENERLLQDSLNRAKMAVNFTDPPLLSLSTTTSTIPNHSTMKTLHQHQNFP
ncbi:sphingosine kinase B-like isoform X1 [Chironomus tepperi]|uniref:sphingosine kinase B-like isoform X1 n=1 Tax=Chironomus tepperi TaxID=113505 RepID=UPI00391FA45C